MPRTTASDDDDVRVETPSDLEVLRATERQRVESDVTGFLAQRCIAHLFHVRAAAGRATSAGSVGVVPLGPGDGAGNAQTSGDQCEMAS